MTVDAYIQTSLEEQKGPHNVSEDVKSLKLAPAALVLVYSTVEKKIRLIKKSSKDVDDSENSEEEDEIRDSHVYRILLGELK